MKSVKKMKALLCYMFSSFCVVIVVSGQSKLQVTMNSPFERCPDFKGDMKIILTDLKFIQKTDYDFTLNGKYTIKEEIKGPISIRVTSKKYERGTWVNSMLNQNIKDLCAEMEKKEHPVWIKMFQEWTVDGKCPLVKKDGEYKDFIIFESKNSAMLPPNFHGKYKSESRFYQTINGLMVEFGCYIIQFELTNV